MYLGLTATSKNTKVTALMMGERPVLNFRQADAEINLVMDESMMEIIGDECYGLLNKIHAAEIDRAALATDAAFRALVL